MATEALIERVSSNTKVACTHCGLAVPAGLVEDAERSFCCEGCRMAYAILNEHGLGSYYGFNDRRELAVRASGRSYEEFDHPAFHERYVRHVEGGRARVELYLEGVHCASCVWLVERLPLVVQGVARAELDVRRSLAVVEWDDAALPLSRVARSLDQLGYAPHPYRGVARDEIRRQEDRAMLVRIGIAGAIAINVMLASLALYSGELHGMDPTYARLFRWISCALVIPSIVWPGRIFFVGAWAALRTRSLHMDLPIAIALLAGVVRGTMNTVSDSGPVYFDGLAVLVFALLAGRFLQQRGQRLAADGAELLHSVAPLSARILENGALRDIPADALLPGMIIDVRAGESFGADGVVVEGRSSVNAALLTGESRPVPIGQGVRVYAGTLNVEAPVQVLVEQSGESRRIAQLLQQVELAARRRAPVVLLANRMAGLFVAVVLLLAVVTFVVKLRLDPARALDDAIALLIVTCPCALALATPLAITVAVGRAARRGMLIKGADALELLAKPGTLVLDKTGTLTEGAMSLVAWNGAEWVKPLVFALESGSSHPVAEAFRQSWPEMEQALVEDARTVGGAGLEGTVSGHRVLIGSPEWVLRHASLSVHFRRVLDAQDATLTPVLIAVDRVVAAVAGIGDRIRDDARASLDILRARGWTTIMLSGDAPGVAASVGSALGFDASDAIGGATPEGKLKFVEALVGSGRVVMVGDGVNDAAAIAAAHVGIGVHGGAEACLATADVYLARQGLAPLVELMDGAQRTMRVIRRNIAFSLIYNVAGAVLAVSGMLTPLLAAILMPASSITVVIASWKGRTFDRRRA